MVHIVKRPVALLFVVLLSACGQTQSGGAGSASNALSSNVLPASASSMSERVATANVATALIPDVASSPTPPNIGGCQIFPANNPWNTNISAYPLDPNSANYISTITADGGNQFLHPDFGEDPAYGIPYVVVPQTQPLVPMTFLYASQSNPGPYPYPPNAPIEGGTNAGGDRHVLVLQQGTCSLYETWHSHPLDSGAKWHAGSGALFNLSSNTLRPNGWTSADAAGLPILPALVKCQEIKAGVINHALRVTFEHTQNGYIHPATHEAGVANTNYPPMGLRLRLKSSFNISSFNRVSKIILTAMPNYGMFVADNGSDWYFQGEGTGNNPGTCWDDNNLDQLKTVPGSAFEVVETGTILH
jgi:hypothetical protein